MNTRSFRFNYTRAGTIRNEVGDVVNAMVPTGCSVEFFREVKPGTSEKNIRKDAIEYFRELNGGQLPTFEMVAQ